MSVHITRRKILLAAPFAVTAGAHAMDPQDFETPDMYDGDLEAWAAIPKHKRLPDGVYDLMRPLALAPGFDVIGDGNAVLRACCGFSGNAAVEMSGEPLKLLPALIEDSYAGSDELHFSGPHGLTVGDTVLIANRQNYSLNGWRSYYRDGEINIVSAIINEGIVRTQSALAPERGEGRLYPTQDCNVYRLSTAGARLEGFKVEVAENAMTALKIERMTGMRLHGVHASGGKHSSILLNHCMDTVFTDECSASCTSPPTGYQYGLAISMSRATTVEGGVWHGTRHGIALGMADTTAAVPVRNTTILRARMTASHEHAADGGHGCHFDTLWFDCQAQGYLVGGGRSRWIGGTIEQSAPALATKGSANVIILGSEMHDTAHTIEVERVHTLNTGQEHPRRSLISIGEQNLSLGGDNGNGARTPYGGTLSLHVRQLLSPRYSFRRPLIAIYNRGAQEPWSVNVRVDDLRMTGSYPHLLYITVIEGAAPRSVYISGGRGRSSKSPYVVPNGVKVLDRRVGRTIP